VRSALVWNIRGLTSAGTASLHETHLFLDTFDFVFLSESRHCHICCPITTSAACRPTQRAALARAYCSACVAALASSPSPGRLTLGRAPSGSRFGKMDLGSATCSASATCRLQLTPSCAAPLPTDSDWAGSGRRSGHPGWGRPRRRPASPLHSWRDRRPPRLHRRHRQHPRPPSDAAVHRHWLSSLHGTCA